MDRRKCFLEFLRWVAIAAISANFLVNAQNSLTVTLSSDLASGQPVGTQVTWTVSSAGASGTPVYRFEFMDPTTTTYKVVRDYGSYTQFKWAALTEGTWHIRVTVMDATNSTAQTVQMYTLLTRVMGGTPAVSTTLNPLVALYSAPPCGINSVQVKFQLFGKTTWQSTPIHNCQGALSVNFYVAGLYSDSSYTMQQIVSGSGTTAGPKLTFETGSLPFVMPRTTVVTPAGAGTSSEGVLLTSFVSSTGLSQIGAVATDLSGGPIWFYGDLDLPTQTRSYLCRPALGGTFFAFLREGNMTDFYFKELDLAGNTVRQTNATRVSQQLTAMGIDAINFFSHEALRLANGHTLTLGSAERLLTNVQGPGVVDVLGDVVIDLDSNFQVAWAWSTFDHLDPTRKAVLGETCQANVSCGPIYLAQTANDWTHCNSINYTASDGDITVSCRNQDWVVKIDYKNGKGSNKILWRMGNDGDFTINSTDPYPWYTHQHDFNFDGTNFEVFDNGNTRNSTNGGNSRGQVLSIDEKAMTATLLLNQDLGYYSLAWGTAQRLVNGNSWFLSGTLNGTEADQAAEVTPSGTTNMAIQFAADAYRAFRMKDLWTPDDFVAPTNPYGLAGAALSSSSVSLSWKSSNDNTVVSGYKIYRNGVLAGIATKLSFTDTGLAGKTAYQYTVQSYDYSGNLSAMSAPLMVSTL